MARWIKQPCSIQTFWVWVQLDYRNFFADVVMWPYVKLLWPLVPWCEEFTVVCDIDLTVHMWCCCFQSSRAVSGRSCGSRSRRRASPATPPVPYPEFFLQFLYVYTHTHTRLMALFPGLPRWTGTIKVKPVWILLKHSEWQWHPLGHMQVCTSLKADNHATPHNSVFYRPPSWICWAPIGTTHDEFLMVSIVLQNLVEIDAVVPIIWYLWHFTRLAWKCLFMPPKLGFRGISPQNPFMHIEVCHYGK